jgi:hypothetical protein
LCVIARFGLGGWDISDRLEQAAVVEPVDPFEGGELDRLGAEREATQGACVANTS